MFRKREMKDDYNSDFTPLFMCVAITCGMSFKVQQAIR